MMKKRAIPWAIGLALAILCLTAAVSFAQTPQPSDDQVNAVAKELYCPVCENIPLDVCPTQACSQWRDLIRQKLADGWSKDQIKQYFKVQYGDRVLAEPPREGLNWMVYILPVVFFLGGAYIVFRVIASRKPAPSAASPAASKPTSAPNDPYLKRLDEELKRRE